MRDFKCDLCQLTLEYDSKTSKAIYPGKKMNRKKIQTLLILLMVLAIAWPVHPQLMQKYNKGNISLKNEKDYGNQTDWESLFYDFGHNMAVAPDGSVFISNTLQHSISKFDPKGRYIKSFGTKGMGPGDLYHPGKLSILDDKYLVVSEYMTLQRISIFDLEGKIFKVLRTGRNCSFIKSLKEKNIGYITTQQKDESLKEVKIWVENIDNRKTTLIKTIELPTFNRVRAGNNMLINLGNHCGDPFIARTQKGDILVGASNSPKIEIFSLDGKLIRSFQLKIKPIPVSDRYIEDFKRSYLDEINSNKDAKPFINMVKRMDFEKSFSTYLPYYKSIKVDAEGNILVFPWQDCVDNCKIVVQVYSPDGEFQTEFEIIESDYKLNVDYIMTNIEFTEKGIFAFVQPKKAEDISPRLIKIELK